MKKKLTMKEARRRNVLSWQNYPPEARLEQFRRTNGLKSQENSFTIKSPSEKSLLFLQLVKNQIKNWLEDK